MQKLSPIVDGIVIRDNHIKCLWHCDNIGFGETDIFANKNDIDINSIYANEAKSFDVNTECMGKEFYYEILSSMILYLKQKSNIIN